MQPLNVYGQSKLDGELAVTGTLEKYFIVCIAWVFGLNGKNFIKTMLNIGKKYDTLRVVNIPRGFAHGFLVLSDTAEFCYKCDDFYHANDEGGLAWNDPAIGIEWPELQGEYKGNAGADGYSMLDGTPLNMSAKDQKLTGFGNTN